MLLPRCHRPELMASLSAAWRARGAVRIEPAIPEARAVLYLRSLRSAEHVPAQRVDPVHGFQVWRYGWEPGTGCEHPLCELGRWLRGDGVQWVSALTGQALAPGRDPMLVSDQARKATFCDPWDEAGPERAVALRVHLTPATWPAEWGGHLERLDATGALVDRWAPAWNAIDLFDLGRASRRRLPMIDRHVEGFTISACFDRR